MPETMRERIARLWRKLKGPPVCGCGLVSSEAVSVQCKCAFARAAAKEGK